MTVKERFLKYVQVETTSNPDCDTCPSTPGQWTLANMLVEEMKAMGIQDARVDEHCYVYGTIPAKGNHLAKVGLIAHMDTSDGVMGPTHPQVIDCYDGKPITLKNGVVIDGFDFLKDLKGDELIVTSGDSVLGGDDKAGVAEIMTLAELLCREDAPEHCTVCIAFTPDEEIGRGADLFDVAAFGAEYGYTVDGGKIGELEYENFNAASMEVTVHGVNIHPGSAKNQMKNACLVAMEWNSLLPPAETPAHTEGYEGFYHVTDIKGNVEDATVDFIIRDHDRKTFEKRKEFFKETAARLNKIYGEERFTVEVKDSYHNMKEMIEKEMHVVDNLKEAMLKAGVTPKVSPIRGGTDGARLSYEGLLCPNLCTGSEGHHGRNEFACIEDMDQIVEILKQIIYVYADFSQ